MWGEGTGAYEKGTFGKSWGCYPVQHLRNLYKRLCRKLKSDDPFGPFDAISVLIGEENARLFCREKINLCWRPPSIVKEVEVDSLDIMEIDNN